MRMVQLDAYRSPEVGSVVFFRVGGAFCCQAVPNRRELIFLTLLQKFQNNSQTITRRSLLPYTRLSRMKWAFQRYIRIYIVKIIDDNGRFLKKIEKNRAESQNRHFFRKL